MEELQEAQTFCRLIPSLRAAFVQILVDLMDNVEKKCEKASRKGNHCLVSKPERQLFSAEKRRKREIQIHTRESRMKSHKYKVLKQQCCGKYRFTPPGGKHEP